MTLNTDLQKMSANAINSRTSHTSTCIMQPEDRSASTVVDVLSCGGRQQGREVDRTRGSELASLVTATEQSHSVQMAGCLAE